MLSGIFRANLVKPSSCCPGQSSRPSPHKMPAVYGHFSRGPVATLVRDGYAEFYEYDVAGQPTTAKDSDDAFARWFGYSTADEVVPKFGVVHLPDQDLMSSARSDPTESSRSDRDASETSLQIVRPAIRDLEMQLRVSEGDVRDVLRRNIELVRK
mmetsp:Transcript_113705/g.328329  ORF Transcript_113705/g.328329 Transcript_113705/m.328329 type:complete len:155 (+) Transcript_113705:1-465(+)